jgi:oleate hydratase
MTSNNRPATRGDTKAYLVGGGIAALAAAAYLIRDGGLPGANITILEETEKLGGSLDGAGAPEKGYVIRGGRMLTYEAYVCTFDLLSFVPSLGDPAVTVKDEIYAFNEKNIPHSKARLVRGGHKVDVTTMGFSARDRLDLIELMATPEQTLGARRISEMFQPSFFTTNFWYMWVTTFAFQPWHSAVELKRYMHHFIQEFPRIETLGGVRRTPYNQYDSIVLPLTTWLKAQGVRFDTGVRVDDLDFRYGPTGKTVERMHVVAHGAPKLITVGDGDLVFVTNGSMTTASTLGAMGRPAELVARDGKTDGSWALWETLANKHPEFGRPSAFNGNVDESKWLSFTTTLSDPLFFDLMEKFTGNVAGTGGLVTFTDSNWLLSVVLAAQPHFLGQPASVQTFWGYGLFVDQVGNFVNKKMSDCSGEELMTELIGHLRFDANKDSILKASNCIPCMMPYITSQFMPRVKGDRPDVIPAGTTNLAFLGQYCEIPDDTVFTVEYSVRSAQMAVIGLLGLENKPTPFYKGEHDPAVLYRAMKALMR